MAEGDDHKSDFRDTDTPFEIKDSIIDDFGGQRDTLDETSSKLSRGTRKAKKYRGEREMIKVVSVSDSTTGIVLFEKVYRWPDKAQTSMLGSLMQSFCQFAREVDDGGIVSVNFESQSKHRRGPSSNFRARVTRTLVDTMKMVCIKGTRASISVYYDMQKFIVMREDPYERLRNFMQELHARFEETYAAEIDGLKDELKAAAEAPQVDERQMEAIHSNFLAFEDVVEKLREDIFPQYENSSQTSSAFAQYSSMSRTSSGLTKGSMQFA